jgi:hypothetical protein
MGALLTEDGAALLTEDGAQILGGDSDPEGGVGLLTEAGAGLLTESGAHILVSRAAVAVPAAPPRPVIVIAGSVGCATWSAVLSDPLLRPLRRLPIRSGQVEFAANQPGTARVEYRRGCGEDDVIEGWHHLCLYRSDRPRQPLFAGPVTEADAVTVGAEDLSSLFAQRVVINGGLMSETVAADPTTWVRRLLADANRQAALPIVLAPHGPFGDVQAPTGASRGDTLDQVLDTLTDLGVVWSMQGPVLRFGVNWSAPDGGLLTNRDFHRFQFSAGGPLVTEVLAVGDDGQVGSWPPSPRRTPPVGVVSIDARSVSSPTALTRIARIHYERTEGRTVKVAGAQLRRGSPRSVRDFIPGRRFVVAEPGRALRSVVTSCSVTIGGGGAEVGVTVDLDKAVPARTRQAA